MQRKRGSSKKYSAKGRSRRVATEEEIIARNAEKKEDESGDASSAEEGSESESEGPRSPKGRKDKKSGVRSEEEDSSDESDSSGFEICNPNRNRKAIEKTGIVELSRREREELQRQEFERQKMSLMAQGKLKFAREDLARLAEVRKQRELAMARKMEQMSLKGKE